MCTILKHNEAFEMPSMVRQTGSFWNNFSTDKQIDYSLGISFLWYLKYSRREYLKYHNQIITKELGLCMMIATPNNCTYDSNGSLFRKTNFVFFVVSLRILWTHYTGFHPLPSFVISDQTLGSLRRLNFMGNRPTCQAPENPVKTYVENTVVF